MTVSPDTLVPVSVLGALLGGAMWLATLYTETHANTEALQEMRTSYQDDRTRLGDRLEQMSHQLEVLTTKMQILVENKEKRRQ